MRKIATLITLLFLLISCGSTKNNNVIISPEEGEIIEKPLKEESIMNDEKEIDEITMNEDDIEDINTVKKSNKSIQDIVGERNLLLGMTQEELSQLDCGVYEDITLIDICKKIKINSKGGISIQKEIKINKEEKNKREKQGDISVCNDAYEIETDINKCMIGIIISLNKSCSILDQNIQDECNDVVKGIEFIDQYNKSLEYYNQYNHLILK